MAEYAATRSDDPWRYLYEFAVLVFDALAQKTYIAERLQPAYQADDRETLRDLADTHLPCLAEKMTAVHRMHRRIWMAHNSTVGWSGLDLRYAGVIARAETARELLCAYLAGERAKIESLEEVRLEKPLNGFWDYQDLTTVAGYGV